MIILDTNVISALMRHPADEAVVAWLDRQPRSSIWTTSITLLELYYGLQVMALGRKRTALMKMQQRLEILITEKLQRRIASFDQSAAEHAADLMAARKKAGRPVELRDTMIAGIALASSATLATRNFDDLPISVIDPWTARL